MDSKIKELKKHCIAYAVMMRASQVITERELHGIKVSLEAVEEKHLLDICIHVLSALNQKLEMGIRKAIENQRLIIV